MMLKNTRFWIEMVPKQGRWLDSWKKFNQPFSIYTAFSDRDKLFILKFHRVKLRYLHVEVKVIEQLPSQNYVISKEACSEKRTNKLSYFSISIFSYVRVKFGILWLNVSKIIRNTQNGTGKNKNKKE